MSNTALTRQGWALAVVARGARGARLGVLQTDLKVGVGAASLCGAAASRLWLRAAGLSQVILALPQGKLAAKALRQGAISLLLQMLIRACWLPVHRRAAALIVATVWRRACGVCTGQSSIVSHVLYV